KWLRRIEVRAEPWDGFYQRTAYRLLAPDQQMGPGVGIELGEMTLNADFLSPEDGGQVPSGPVEISGYAFAGGRREVTRVDVSTDEGATWIQAQLLEEQGRWAWRLWQATIELGPGDHDIIARAWDSAANTQPERPSTVWNPKGYVNNSW